MAEFQKVIRQKKRMCQSVLCCKCDIYLRCGQELSRCQPFINNNPQKAEEIIMRWAANHPEPVYPTWIEWFREIGVVPPEQKGFHVWLHDNIPADIAQKLGLKSKEG